MGKDCEEEYIVARSSDEAITKAREKYGKNVEIYQDPDVLDTWFSRFVAQYTQLFVIMYLGCSLIMDIYEKLMSLSQLLIKCLTVQ